MTFEDTKTTHRNVYERIFDQIYSHDEDNLLLSLGGEIRKKCAGLITEQVYFSVYFEYREHLLYKEKK